MLKDSSLLQHPGVSPVERVNPGRLEGYFVVVVPIIVVNFGTLGSPMGGAGKAAERNRRPDAVRGRAEEHRDMIGGGQSVPIGRH